MGRPAPQSALDTHYPHRDSHPRRHRPTSSPARSAPGCQIAPLPLQTSRAKSRRSVRPAVCPEHPAFVGLGCDLGGVAGGRVVLGQVVESSVLPLSVRLGDHKAVKRSGWACPLAHALRLRASEPKPMRTSLWCRSTGEAVLVLIDPVTTPPSKHEEHARHRTRCRWGPCTSSRRSCQA